MNKKNRSGTYITLGSLALVAIFGLSPLNPLRVGGAQASTIAPPAQPGKVEVEVERVALDALITAQNLGSDATAVTWAVSPAPVGLEDGASASARAVPTSTEGTDRATSWHAHVAQIFTGAAVSARMNKTIDATVANLPNPDERNLGGGVTAIKFTHAVVGETTASLTVDATIWAAFAYKLPTGTWKVAHPSSPVTTTLDLVKSAGGTWTVENMVQSFANGSGP